MSDTSRLNKMRADLHKHFYALRFIRDNLHIIADKEAPASNRTLAAAMTLDGVVIELENAIKQVTEAFDASRTNDTENAS